MCVPTPSFSILFPLLELFGRNAFLRLQLCEIWLFDLIDGSVRSGLLSGKVS